MGEICPGVLDNYGPLVVEIVKDKNNQQSALDACIFLNSCPPPEFDGNQKPLEDIYMPGVPLFTGIDVFENEAVDMARDKRDADEHIFRVVQLADVHFDDEYAVGSVAECGFHVCCRSNYNGTGSAHAIGEYTCNLPQSTVSMFLDKIAELKPDLVLQTGDTPPHHLWYEDPEKQIAYTDWLARELTARMGNTPVITAVGNHDVFPSNMFYMKRNATKDTLQALIDGYPILHNSPDLQETFKAGGFYEYEIRKGLRAIVYNSNYGYTDNWFNLLSHFEEADYLEMRQFIERRLAAARNDKVKVIFVTHHPVGDGIITFDSWVTDLALQYSDNIVLHVAGHKHTDQFHLFIREGDRWASGVQFAAPSSNTYNSINPSLRLYELDSRNFHLRDYKQYHLDIEKAHKLATEIGVQVTSTQVPDLTTESSMMSSTSALPEPQIELIYSAKEEYGMHDLSPAAWHDLASRMMHNITVLHQYQSNFGTRVSDDVRGLCSEDDKACQRAAVCNVVTSTMLANMRCNRDGVKLPTGEVPTEEPVTDNPNSASLPSSTALTSFLLMILCKLLDL